MNDFETAARKWEIAPTFKLSSIVTQNPKTDTEEIRGKLGAEFRGRRPGQCTQDGDTLPSVHVACSHHRDTQRSWKHLFERSDPLASVSKSQRKSTRGSDRSVVRQNGKPRGKRT